MNDGCEIEIRESGKKPIRLYKESGSGPAFVGILFREACLLAMKEKINDVASFMSKNTRFKPIKEILYENTRYFCELDITKNYDNWIMKIGIVSDGKIKKVLEISVKELTEDKIKDLIELEKMI